MKTRPHFLHLMMVPVLTFLVCNPLANGVLEMAATSSGSYLKNAAVLLTLFYGTYLQFFRNYQGRNWPILGGAAAVGIVLPHLPLPWPLWVFALSLFFSTIRILILEKSARAFPRDLAAFWVGFLVAGLLAPLGMMISVAGFLLIQIIAEFKDQDESPAFHPDRFQESYKTADRILKTFQTG